ncbi:MAG: RNA polymerase sigma factor [Vicinamibacterales bacterium]
MSDATAADLQAVAAHADAERTLGMTEDAFGVFYEWTARPLWLYLARLTGDRRHADDLLQEAYYRLLRSTAAFESDEHRRHYLFRIATNLVHDGRRRVRPDGGGAEAMEARVADGRPSPAEVVADRLDVDRALGALTPKERRLLLLAYGQGFSYDEIATAVGVKVTSLKPLLYRARQRLLRILHQAGRGRGGRS